MEHIATAPLWATALLLLVAGLIKLKDPRALNDSLRIALKPLASGSWVRTGVRVLGLLEIVIAGWAFATLGSLLTPPAGLGGVVGVGYVLTGALGMFTAYTLLAVVRGASCGCFGQAFAAATAGPAEIVRNLLLTLGAAAATLSLQTGTGTAGFDLNLLAATAIFLAVVAASTLLTGYVIAARRLSKAADAAPGDLATLATDATSDAASPASSSPSRRQLLRTAAIGAAGYASFSIITKDQAMAATPTDPALLRSPLERNTVERVLVGEERDALVAELRQRSAQWEPVMRQHGARPRWSEATASAFVTTLGPALVQWQTLAIPTSGGGMLAYSPEMGEGGRVLAAWSANEGILWQGDQELDDSCLGCLVSWIGAVTGCSSTAISCPGSIAGGPPAMIACGLGVISCGLGGVGIGLSCPTQCTSMGAYERCIAIHQAYCQVPVSSNCRPVTCKTCGCSYGCCLSCSSGCHGVIGGPICFEEVSVLNTSHCCAAGCCCPESYNLSSDQISDEERAAMTERINLMTDEFAKLMQEANG